MTDHSSNRVLIVGYGSIGQRHLEVLTDLGCAVAVVSRRPGVFERQYANIGSALIDWMPQYCVIASRTSEHANDINALATAGFTGKLLIEKPIFDEERPVPAHQASLVRVAFNLRCHPLMQALLDVLKGHEIRAAHGYVGQYLPNWRPNQDYRKSYSASANEGGGVLLDLSHDIDIIAQIIGDWTALTALGGKVSGLEITSDDCFGLLFQSQTCPIATLNMNYLDHRARREYLVHCDSFSLKADFIAGTLERNDHIIFQQTVARNDTYFRMHMDMLQRDGEGLCTVNDGLRILATIAAARKAAQCKVWKTNA